MGFATRPLLAASVENPDGVAIGPTLDAIRRLAGRSPASPARRRRRFRTPARASGSRPTTRADRTRSSSSGRRCTGDFFATLGVPLRAGRSFSSQDSPAARVADRQRDAGEAPVPGAQRRRPARLDRRRAARHRRRRRRLRAQSDAGRAAPHPKVFLPLAADAKNLRRLRFVVRAESRSRAARPAGAARRRPRRRRARSSPAPTRSIRSATVGSQEVLVGTAPLVPLIAIGTLLTTAGIYGVLAFAITRRSRELAVRMAIGATSRRRRAAGDRAHGPARRHRRGAGHRRDVRAVARRPRGGRRRQHLRSARSTSSSWPVVAVIVIGAVATWVPSRRALRINPAGAAAQHVMREPRGARRYRAVCQKSPVRPIDAKAVVASAGVRRRQPGRGDPCTTASRAPTSVRASGSRRAAAAVLAHQRSRCSSDPKSRIVAQVNPTSSHQRRAGSAKWTRPRVSVSRARRRPCARARRRSRRRS